MTIARIENGAVAELRAADLSSVPEHKRSQWRTLSGDKPAYDPNIERLEGPSYQIGDTEVVRTWSKVPLDAETVKAKLKAYCAQKRFSLETWGCVVNGHHVDTNRESQGKLVAEFVAIQAGLRVDPSVWKMKDGTFVSLSNADMSALILAARTHIATTFAVESAINAAIDAGSITTTFALDLVSFTEAP